MQVGLIHRGNEQQIPLLALSPLLCCSCSDDHLNSAYEIYRGSEKNEKARERAENFKETLCRDIEIHFVGLWYVSRPSGVPRLLTLPLRDTVSSVREKMPGTNELHKFVCYLRHAVAMDECRVKFLVELVCGGASIPPDKRKVRDRAGVLRMKEVCFPGSHSDV